MATRIVKYEASPTAAKLHNSTKFVRGIMGPIGSGKSVGMCWEIFKRAQEQKPGPDGMRRTRWLVVRNTLPQLETTTIKTWLDWFPQDLFGKISGKPPYTQNIRFNDIRMEVIFIALDKPEDVKKLLSFECTGIWFNEAREIPKEVLDAATGRVGRFPAAKDGGCTWSGVIMDTNPPDDSHWFYDLAEQNTPEDWEFFYQPSGLADNAENLENLNQPDNYEQLTIEERRAFGRKYYERMLGGKTQEWINVYVHGKYGFIKDGMPVYNDSWNDSIHSTDEIIKVNPDGDLICGVDCSGRNPAAIFIQPTPIGQYQVVDEIVCEGMGAVKFSELLAREVQRRYPRNTIRYYGDPSGANPSQNDERTYFEILRDKGINIYPAPTSNKIGERIQVVESALSRLVSGGRPALVVSKKCVILRRGFNGGYKFRRLSVSGEPRYDPVPEKNRFSDPHDGLQYGLLGAGEGYVMRGRQQRRKRGNITAKININV